MAGSRSRRRPEVECGRDNGRPGERAYHPGYYGAFVLDPDGNNIEAVYHGEAKQSAPYVRVRF